ncbi:MAG: hypothetical protein PWP45_998 [Tepidanaerobacteraceae bacterium]|nr:hypothetical protein [Tepidanaerobacteraceae bacterium]
MKLNKIKDNVYYIDGAVNMGLVAADDGSALLLDAGIDDSVSRKARRIVEESGFKLKGIAITHAHADHSGGAPYLVKTSASFFVPAHGAPVYDIKPVVEANRQRIRDTIEYITSLLKEPLTAEEVLKGVCERFQIEITTMTQYYLMNLTVMAYIGYLLDEGLITKFYEKNRQYFREKS